MKVYNAYLSCHGAEASGFLANLSWGLVDRFAYPKSIHIHQLTDDMILCINHK